MDIRTITGRHGTFRVDARDLWVGRSLLAYGEYAEAELAFLRRITPDMHTVLVAGAHLGALAVPLAAQARHLHAFEPRRGLCALLAENFAANGLRHAVAHHAALGAAPGELVVPPLPDAARYNSGGIALASDGDGEAVAVLRLDDMQFSRVDLLTADVEGMELDVLRGAEATLTRHQPILYLEADRPDRTPALLDWLFDRGWTAFWHTPPLFNPRNHAGRRDDVLRNQGRAVVSFNLLCLPPGLDRPDLTEDLLPARRGDTHLVAMGRGGAESPPAIRTDKSVAEYLFLHWRGAKGLVAEAPSPLPPDTTATSLLMGDALLRAPDWRALLAHQLRCVAHVGLDLTDCRQAEPPPGCARVTLDEVAAAVLDLGASLEEADLVDGRIYVVAASDGRGEDRRWRKAHRHCLVIRTGAHGDGLMAGSILPALKARGWTLTLACNGPVHDVLQADPHVDEFIRLPDGMKIAGEHLAGWHAALARRFDRVINLTWMVETHLLPQPENAAYHFPPGQRRALFAGSYLGAHHRAAGLSAAPYAVRFYPTELESAWARAHAERIGPFAMLVLRGSGPHKWWPHWPAFVCRLLAATRLSIVLAGDAAAQADANRITQAVLDTFGTADRLHSLVDQGSIRRPMALAQAADLAVGPETGILHAVALEAVPKVVLLSHSAPSNLTDDWTMAHAVRAAVPCQPCHRLRHAPGDCPTDLPSGAALCAAAVPASTMVAAALAMLELGGAEAAECA